MQLSVASCQLPAKTKERRTFVGSLLPWMDRVKPPIWVLKLATDDWLLVTGYRQLLYDPRYQIVIVRFGDFTAVELAFTNIVMITKIVHVHCAINLRSMHRRAALPQ